MVESVYSDNALPFCSTMQLFISFGVLNSYFDTMVG